LTNSVQNINKIKTGTCPHGLAPGACPVCSMSAGSMKQSDRNRKLGEMTYHECAMIGNMLRAKALAEKNHEKMLERWSEKQKNFDLELAKMSENIIRLANKMSNTLLFKPIAFLIINTALPTINTVRNFTSFVMSISNKIHQIKQTIIDIVDKLTAIYGEIKNFIQKKVSELISMIKTKFTDMFKILKKNNSDNDDSKVDEDKKIFNLKRLISTIFNKKKDKNNEQSSKHK